MKKILTMLCTIALLISCQSNINNVNPSDKQLQTMKKRITQHIDVNGMGMIKDFTIDSINKVSDTSCFARHFFHNPMFDKDVRVSTIYYFNTGIDSVKATEDVLTEMKSEGEWVHLGY